MVKVLCVEIDPRLKRANCQEKFFARFTLPYGNYNLDADAQELHQGRLSVRKALPHNLQDFPESKEHQ